MLEARCIFTASYLRGSRYPKLSVRCWVVSYIESLAMIKRLQHIKGKYYSLLLSIYSINSYLFTTADKIFETSSSFY